MSENDVSKNANESAGFNHRFHVFLAFLAENSLSKNSINSFLEYTYAYKREPEVKMGKESDRRFPILLLSQIT